MYKKTVISLILSSLFSGLSYGSSHDESPNIIIIVADDMGYSDISPFGGEIPTPNLQKLAEQGIRMSHFYTSPMSAPARSMLLTGNSNQQAGMGGMLWYENTVAQPGYEMRLTDRVTLMSERFHDAGYATMIAGKWHLGYNLGATPQERGFEHSFVLMGGGASHFNDEIPLGTIEKFHSYYTLNGKRVTLPSDFYSSKSYANQIIKWIEATPKEKPVFAYLAFTAPHDPLQAPDEWIEKFRGQYEQGYQVIYHERINRLKKLGIISENTPLPSLELDKEWSKLSKEQKKYNAKIMQVYASMISNMDYQIGKLFQSLKKTGRYKNSIIIFLSDNGANPKQGFYYRSEPKFWQSINNDYSNLGRKGSFISYGPNWANVSNTPYAYYHKGTSGQGGINTAFIISIPKSKRKGSIESTPIAIYDIAPTLYDLAKIDVSTQTKYVHRLPMIGVSFKNYFCNAFVSPPRLTFATELHKNAVYIENSWKLRRLVKHGADANLPEWELFDLFSDPLETNNIAHDNLKLLKHLIAQYHDFADKTMVIEAKGKSIPYTGVDGETGQYFGIDPLTKSPTNAQY